MKNTFIYIAIVSIFALTSCKNKLDVLAPGEESVSVYGILNPQQTTQSIRINKVFLTEGDATVASQDANQVNYAANELEVSLQRFETGSTTPTVTTVGNTTKKQIVLTETVVTTQSGSFSTEQRLWQTNDKLFTTGNYRLNIKNTKTGKEWYAQTAITDSVKPGASMPIKYFINATNPGQSYPNHGGYISGGTPGTNTPDAAYVNFSNLAVVQTIKFKSVKDARMYSVVMRFHYIDSVSGLSTKFKNFVDQTFPIQKSTTLTGGEDIIISFTADQFYSNLGSELSKRSVSNLATRKVDYMEYIVMAGGENLSDFLLINAPSTSIAQDKPTYTNIIGGNGIFSSKSRCILTKDLHSDFINKIACHPSTFGYRFLNFGGSIPTSKCP